MPVISSIKDIVLCRIQVINQELGILGWNLADWLSSLSDRATFKLPARPALTQSVQSDLKSWVLVSLLIIRTKKLIPAHRKKLSTNTCNTRVSNCCDLYSDCAFGNPGLGHFLRILFLTLRQSLSTCNTASPTFTYS